MDANPDEKEDLFYVPPCVKEKKGYSCRLSGAERRLRKVGSTVESSRYIGRIAFARALGVSWPSCITYLGTSLGAVGAKGEGVNSLDDTYVLRFGLR